MKAARRRESAGEAALPAEVVVGSASRWFAYRRYPVFSGPWLRKRLLLFALAIAVLAVVAVLVSDALLGRPGAGLPIAALVFACFMLIGFAGPSLACLVRARAERRAPPVWQVVVAVVVGMAIAAAMSQIGLRPLERELRSGTSISRVTKFGPDASHHPPQMVLPGEGNSLVIAGQLRPSPWLTAISLIADGALYFFIGGGFAFFAWLREQRRLEQHEHVQVLASVRAEKQLADLRLGVLQSQVEPHFLFNTLAALRSLLRSDPVRAEAMLDALVDYLRATIPKLRADAGRVDTCLADQVELCRRYLELMQLRMGERLQFRIDLPEALGRLPFPPLLLISLVENAVKHGLEPKPGPALLTLKARRLFDRLEVSVSDDGIGLQTGLGPGLGLANIRAQLATRFGNRAKFAICNREHGDGVIATIQVPLTEEPA